MKKNSEYDIIKQVLCKYEDSVSYDYTQFDISQYNQIMSDLIHELYYSIDMYHTFDRTDNINARSYVYINESYINELNNDNIINNISRISINSLYPKLMIKLYDQGLIKCNSKLFINVIKLLFEARNEFKKDKDISNKIIYIIKLLINYTYGATFKKNNTFYISNHHMIKSYLNSFYDYLINKYSDDIIQITVDQIYFRNNPEIIDYVYDYLEHLDLECRYEDNLSIELNRSFFKLCM